MTEEEFNEYHMFWMEVFVLGQWIAVELGYNSILTYRLKANAIKKVNTVYEEDTF